MKRWGIVFAILAGATLFFESVVVGQDRRPSPSGRNSDEKTATVRTVDRSPARTAAEPQPLPISPIVPMPVELLLPIAIGPTMVLISGPEQPEPVEYYPDDPEIVNDPSGAWDQFSGFSSRFRSSYAATVSTYGIGANVSIPLTDFRSSELLFRTGVASFLKGREYIDGVKANSSYLPLSLAVKTTHYTSQLSNAEFILYSTFGGGPVLGMTLVNRSYDDPSATDEARFAVAGELFGSIGTEMTLHSGQGVYCELGLSYLGIAGRTLSEETSFIAPTFSIGFRFH